VAEQRLSAATNAGDSDKEENVSFDNYYDDEYGFDQALHVCQPPENPAVTEERPIGSIRLFGYVSVMC